MACNHKSSCSSCNSDSLSMGCVSEKEVFQRKRILIYCTGNSCRSQMAEGWLSSFDERLDVYSAGTKPETKVNSFAVNVMAEVGIDISFHYPKSVEKYINQDFDYVISLCNNAKNICPAFNSKVMNVLHIGFDDPADAKGSDAEITEVYRIVRDQIKDKFYELYQKI